MEQHELLDSHDEAPAVLDPEYVESYRTTTVGMALVQTLNDMLRNEDITESVANEVLENFESSFLDVLKEEIAKTAAPSIKVEVLILMNNHFSFRQV